MLIFWLNTAEKRNTHIDDAVVFFSDSGKYEETTERNLVFKRKLMKTRMWVSGGQTKRYIAISLGI
jgi:hypothetical protein